jgi:hypothetical protein
VRSLTFKVFYRAHQAACVSGREDPTLIGTLDSDFSGHGDIFAGLYYPLGNAFLTLVVGTLLLPETRGRDIRA